VTGPYEKRNETCDFITREEVHLLTSWETISSSRKILLVWSQVET